MSNFCAVKVKIHSRETGVLAGAIVSIASCLVSGSRSATYETQGTSDTNGEIIFNVPQGSLLTFASPDTDINGWKLTVPNTNAFEAGVFFVNPANVVSARQLSGSGAVVPGIGVSVKEYGDEACRKIVLTLLNVPVTLVKNGTSTGGGGTKLYTFPEGFILPVIATSNLTVANALDKSFLASLGSVAADTGGTLTSTEANVAPSTAATTTSGAGTCKMKSTASAPAAGVPLDGSATAIPLYLNACLNADATGAEALTFSGTITINYMQGGDQ